MPTSITYTRSTTVVPPESMPSNMAGYRLNYSVTSATDMPATPFIFQRQMRGPGAEDFEDFFYSVATVAEINSLSADDPAEDDVFYLSGSLQLVFGNPDDMHAASVQIESAIAELCTQNDKSLEMTAPVTITFPTPDPEPVIP